MLKRTALGSAVVAFGVVFVAACSADTTSLREAVPISTIDNVAEGSETLIVGGSVVTATKHGARTSISTFDAATGKRSWAKSAVGSSPVWVSRHTVTYLSKKGSLTVVDTTSGNTVHEFKGSYVNQGTHGQHVAEVADGSLYMVNPNKAGHDELTAIDATTGETHWPSSSGGSEKLSWVLAPSPQHALGATSDTNAPRQSEVLQPIVEPKVVYAYWDSDPKGIEVLDASTGKRIGGVHDINPGSVTRVVTADESHVVAVSEVGDQACDRTLSSFDTHSQTAQAITTHLNTYDAHKKTWRCADAKSDGVQISGDGIYAQDAKHHPQIRDLSTGKATWTADEQGEPLILGDGVALYRAIGAKGTGPVKAVDIKTGKRLWSSDGIHPTSTSTIADGQLLTAEGKATRVTDLHTGEALWQYADAVLAGVDAKNYLFWTGSSSNSVKKALVITKHSGKKGS